MLGSFAWFLPGFRGLRFAGSMFLAFSGIAASSLLCDSFATADLFLRIHGAAAFFGAAVADGFVVAAVVEAVIVGDLFARGDWTDGLDPDAAADFAGFAVGVATVVDEHGHAVAVDDDLAGAESKKIGDGRGFVGLVGFGFAEARAGVFGHAAALGDGRCSVAAGGVDGGGADNKIHAVVRCSP